MIADRNEIDRAPSAPQASGPVANPPFRRAAWREGAQDGAIKPEYGLAIGGIGQDSDGQNAIRDDAGSRNVALECPGVAEPVPAGEGAAHDSKFQVVCGLRQCLRVISRRLPRESMLRFALAASCAMKRATSAAVLTKPAAGAIALAGLSPGTTRRRPTGRRSG